MSSLTAGPHQGQPLLQQGKPPAEAEVALILLHGRGATAHNILEIGHLLAQPQMALLAPQAANNTWYPYSFLAPMAQNEPGLSSGLQTVAEAVDAVEQAGISAEKIILGGFSQGACLASEFVARNARRYGGLLIFSGGLIGPPGTPRHYEGSLAGTPVFLGCSDVDFHIPLARVEETAVTLGNLGADVNKKIYSGMSHAINQDEIDEARKIINGIFATD